MVAPLTSGERERAIACARGITQYNFVCKLLAGEEVAEPTYGLPISGGARKRQFKLSAYSSFDNLTDRLAHAGFTVHMRRDNTQRFYRLARTADVQFAARQGRVA